VTRHPVFFDPTKRRSVILGRIGWTVSVVSTIVLLMVHAFLWAATGALPTSFWPSRGSHAAGSPSSSR